MAWVEIKSSFLSGYYQARDRPERQYIEQSELEEERGRRAKFANECKFNNPDGPAFVYEDTLLTSEERIRLLELLPGRPEEDIRCRLRKVALFPAPAYEALSYTWGTEQNLQTVYINDRVFKVTQNLRSALRHLRSKTTSLTLWVDALCINQSDVEEKTRQVQLIAKIYSDASKTNVWIGPTLYNSRMGIFLCRILAKAEEGERVEGVLDPIRDIKWSSTEERFARHCLVTKTGPIWNMDLLSLLCRSWFNRAWVIQEVTLSPASELHCGFEKIDWPTFTRAMSYGFKKRLLIPDTARLQWSSQIENADHLAPTRRDASNRSPAELLLSYLMDFKHRQASNPVDKVFSLLGLVDGLQSIGIQADYRKSVGEVYWNVTVQILKHTRTLDVLGALSADPMPGFAPSWTANWMSEMSYPQPLGYTSRQRINTYRAAGSSESKVKFEENGKILVLSGHHYATIEAVSCLLPMLSQEQSAKMITTGDDLDKVIFDSGDAKSRFRNTFEALPLLKRHFDAEKTLLSETTSAFVNWEKFAGVNGQKHDSLSRKYRQVLCAGHYIDDDEQLTQLEFRKWYKSLAGHRRLVKSSPGFVANSKTIVSLMHLGSVWNEVSRFPEVLVFAFGRRLAKVNGEFALMPPNAGVGDEILLCSGGAVPLVAKKGKGNGKGEETGTDGSPRVFLGECYVEGIMKGEAFREELCEELRFR